MKYIYVLIYVLGNYQDKHLYQQSLRNKAFKFKDEYTNENELL